jgi:hypothetical protein
MAGEGREYAKKLIEKYANVLEETPPWKAKTIVIEPAMKNSDLKKLFAKVKEMAGKMST